MTNAKAVSVIFWVYMCEFLGVPIPHEKTLGPHTTLQFAGIELDSLRQEAR